MRTVACGAPTSKGKMFHEKSPAELRPWEEAGSNRYSALWLAFSTSACRSPALRPQPGYLITGFGPADVALCIPRRNQVHHIRP